MTSVVKPPANSSHSNGHIGAMSNGSTTPMKSAAAATAETANATDSNGMDAGAGAPLLLDATGGGCGEPHQNQNGAPAGTRPLIVSIAGAGGSGVGGGGGVGERHHDTSWNLMVKEASLRKSLLVLGAVFCVLGAAVGGVAVLLMRFPQCQGECDLCAIGHDMECLNSLCS